MPPAGLPAEDDLLRLEEWLLCGAPSTQSHLCQPYNMLPAKSRTNLHKRKEFGLGKCEFVDHIQNRQHPHWHPR